LYLATNGNDLINILELIDEVHVPFETANVYDVPATKPPTIVVSPVPVNPVKPAAGLAIIVQEPEDGKPLNGMLPVETTQLGCVIAPKVGTTILGLTVITKL
jgi:hypothetical protein